MKTIILFFSCVLFSCATKTELYKDGNKIAAFQGDMENVSLTITNDSLRWSASKVTHSTTTDAYGKAGRGRIEAITAAAALTNILK